MGIFDIIENVAWHIENTPGKLVNDVQVAIANNRTGKVSAEEAEEALNSLKERGLYIDPDEWLKERQEELSSKEETTFNQEKEEDGSVSIEDIIKETEEILRNIPDEENPVEVKEPEKEAVYEFETESPVEEEIEQDIEVSWRVNEINHSLFVEDINLRIDMKEMLGKMKEQLEILEKAISGTMFVDDYITMMESIKSLKEKEDVLEKLKEKIAGIYDKNL